MSSTYTIHTGQHYNSRWFWLANERGEELDDCDHGLVSDGLFDAMRAAANVFCQHLYTQSSTIFEVEDGVAGFSLIVDMDEWDSGEGFGDWFKQWAEKHHVQVVD